MHEYPRGWKEVHAVNISSTARKANQKWRKERDMAAKFPPAKVWLR